MSRIRNNIELLAYYLEDDFLQFRVCDVNDVFVNKLYDTIESDDFMVESSSDIFDVECNSEDIIITASIVALNNLIWSARPYNDIEIEDLIDAISIMIEQLPVKLRMIADDIEDVGTDD